MTTEDVIKRIQEEHPDKLVMTGYDDCIIGMASRIGMEDCVAFDKDKVLEKLRKVEKMTEEDAIEWFEFNMIGAYVGETTPVFVEVFNGKRN
jgi:hypothetical protein